MHKLGNVEFLSVMINLNSARVQDVPKSPLCKKQKITTCLKFVRNLYVPSSNPYRTFTILMLL